MSAITERTKELKQSVETFISADSELFEMEKLFSEDFDAVSNMHSKLDSNENIRGYSTVAEACCGLGITEYYNVRSFSGKSESTSKVSARVNTKLEMFIYRSLSNFSLYEAFNEEEIVELDLTKSLNLGSDYFVDNPEVIKKYTQASKRAKSLWDQIYFQNLATFKSKKIARQETNKELQKKIRNKEFGTLATDDFSTAGQAGSAGSHGTGGDNKVHLSKQDDRFMTRQTSHGKQLEIADYFKKFFPDVKEAKYIVAFYLYTSGYVNQMSSTDLEFWRGELQEIQDLEDRTGKKLKGYSDLYKHLDLKRGPIEEYMREFRSYMTSFASDLLS